jgi:hypothetical protein
LLYEFVSPYLWLPMSSHALVTCFSLMSCLLQCSDGQASLQGTV